MAQEKSPARLAVLAKIDEYERNEWWTKDLEDDPPTIPLEADKIDYTRSKLKSKISTFIANKIGWSFIKGLVRDKKMILAEPEGLENFEAVKDKGVIMTCNHFNPFDNFAVLVTIDKFLKHHIIWKVIREGNYTSFPGFYGYLFRQCNTLPLSSNFSCQKKFMAAIQELLQKKQKILIYAEQGMWWNYKKPRPLTTGAFRFAVNNNAPVLPFFITMKDTDLIDGDGFPVQEYKVHILPAIYPDSSKSAKENIKEMADKNYQMWKEVYEKEYGIPLTYLKKDDENKTE
ncbi:MAG: 1-acyl-sn-glycerol-3-phosphate acyltransferase [Treponema sp.]|nr:1-acyl-sn-glycerol-3-phosphate acyltransferase [Treponema sp.]